MKLIKSMLYSGVHSGHSPSESSVSSSGALAQSPVGMTLAKLVKTILLGAIVIALSVSPIEAATIYGLTADREVNSDGTMNDVNPMLVGFAGPTPIPTNAVVVFQLPTLPVGQKFASASLTLYAGENGTPTYNADLYALPPSSSSTVQASSFYDGVLDPSATLIQNNIFTPSLVTGPVTSSSANLTTYLNNAYANGAGAGKYVFFRVNPDAYLQWVWTRYTVASAEDPSNMPALTYTTTSAWSTVPLGGGGFVTGLVSSASGADIYCRSDCGGAFSWDAVNGVWHSITDTLVDPTNTPGSNALMSISSLAVDPNNPSQLYVAAGDYPYSTSLRGIYSSSDKGTTWTEINSSIYMNGQGAGKVCGERLAVDPNNSNTLWYGSIQDGLQKGTLSGTWTWTQVPSTSVPFGVVATGKDKEGITFVVFDKNGGHTIAYVGVYDSVGSTGGVYTSTDGTTWSKVGGVTVATPVRGQLASNGTLYVTENGLVAKMTRGGTLQTITPTASVNYDGLAVDSTDATGNTLYVAESSSGSYGRIFRSINGGSTWATQSQTFNGGVQDPPRTEPDGTPTLTGYWFGATSSLLVNPANAHELFAGDFFGVAITEDSQDLGTASGSTWHMIQKNQEQTCPEVLLTAPTGPLMLGQGDVGGFWYNNTGVRPLSPTGGGFGNASGGSNPGMDFSESNNSIWARTWLNGNQNSGSGMVSIDAGADWTVFGEMSQHPVTSGTAAWETWDVGTYLAQQKAKGNNTVTLVICASNSTNPLWSTGAISFDSKEGGLTNAPQLLLNGTTTITTTADSYVTGASTGTNYGSATNLYAGYKTNTLANNYWTFLSFNLSSVSAITSATLKLHRQTQTAGTTWPIGVFACSNTTWTESTITWANRPVTLASGDSTSNYDPFGSPAYYDGTSLLNGGRIAISSTNPNLMVWLPQQVLGAGGVAHYSNDRGVTWTACTGAPTSQLISRDDPSTLLQQLAADRVNGNFYLAKFSGGSGPSHTIYRSTDGGVTWSSVGSISTGYTNVYRCQIVAAPAANDVWVCDDGTGRTPLAGGIWHSTNGGVTWSQVASGVINQVREVSFGKAQSGSGYTVFVAGYKSGVRGIYRSDDGGSTWNAAAVLPTDSDINVLSGDRQNYGNVFMGANGRGVWQGQ